MIGLAFAASLALTSNVALAEVPQSWGQVGFINQFDTDTDRDGDFDVRGGFGRGQIAARFDDEFHVRMLASYYGVAYDFDDKPRIPGGGSFGPWHTIHSARLNAVVGYELNDKITLLGGPLAELALENGGNLSDGLKPGGLVAAEMRVDDNLKFGLGIVGVAEIEEDFYLQPVLMLDWTPNDKVTVRAASWTTRGGELEIVYAINDEFEVAPSVAYQRERFQLKERTLTTSPPPATFRVGSKGVGEDRAFVPALRVSYMPQCDFIKSTVGAMRIDVKAGVAVAGDITLENSKGKKIERLDYDPAPSLGLTISVPL